MAVRHTAELAALEGGPGATAAEAVAVADSLYSVHLDDTDRQGKVRRWALVHCTQGRSSHSAVAAGECQGVVRMHAALCSVSGLHPLILSSVHPPQKPSKGQRRREQRAREDAEREERIRAELAELGDTGGRRVAGGTSAAGLIARLSSLPPCLPRSLATRDPLLCPSQALPSARLTLSSQNAWWRSGS